MPKTITPKRPRCTNFSLSEETRWWRLLLSMRAFCSPKNRTATFAKQKTRLEIKSISRGGANTKCSIELSAMHNMMLGVLGVSAVGLHNPFDCDKPGNPLINPDGIGEDNVVKDFGSEVELDMNSNIEYIQVHLKSNDEITVPGVAVPEEEDLPVQYS
ncbi:hypothetical protein QTP88_024705 [Uroleucon formosanum]